VVVVGTHVKIGVGDPAGKMIVVGTSRIVRYRGQDEAKSLPIGLTRMTADVL